MDQTKLSPKRLLQGALIAAIYAVLTAVLAPISYGPMQLRLSEALTVLPAFTPAAVPGLILGCALGNLLGPYGVFDVLLGALATAAAAGGSYLLRGHDLLVPLPPVIANGLIIGGMLHFVYGVPGFWACVLWIAGGEMVVCYAIGLPLIKLLKKYRHIFE